MAPRPRPRGRLFLLIVFLALGVQVPLLGALAYLLPRALPLAAIGAAALTLSFLTSLRANFRGVDSRRRIYLGMWPFFIWWTVALLFTLLAPLALLLAAALPALTAGGALVGALGGAALLAIPVLLPRARVRRHEVAVANLPARFDGFRIVQISDLHCGPFASGARVARWVAAANALEPDLVAVTGDLIAHGERYVPTVAAALGGLRARDGVYACMGNHDYFTDGEALARALEGAGLTVLRNRGVDLRRGADVVHMAGVDDTWSRRNDMALALARRPPAAPVVLLAHDPALFPDAVAHGVDVMLSGHTHGGQLGLPGAARRFNLARLVTAFTSGLYREGPTTLYVNRGLGTTGPPIRLGVPPEIAVLTLRPAPPARAAVPVPIPATAASARPATAGA